MKILPLFILVLAMTACGKKSSSKSDEAAFTYETALAKGTIADKSVTYSAGYVLSQTATVNGQTYMLGVLNFFSDAKTEICPAVRVGLPQPRLSFFLPVAAGEHVYENDPYIYKTMPGVWKDGTSPNTVKEARATSARISFDVWTKDHIAGKVYATGEQFTINGTFDIKNCDQVLPQNPLFSLIS